MKVVSANKEKMRHIRSEFAPPYPFTLHEKYQLSSRYFHLLTGDCVVLFLDLLQVDSTLTFFASVKSCHYVSDPDYFETFPSVDSPPIGVSLQRSNGSHDAAALFARQGRRVRSKLRGISAPRAFAP